MNNQVIKSWENESSGENSQTTMKNEELKRRKFKRGKCEWGNDDYEWSFMVKIKKTEEMNERKKKGWKNWFM